MCFDILGINPRNTTAEKRGILMCMHAKFSNENPKVFKWDNYEDVEEEEEERRERKR